MNFQSIQEKPNFALFLDVDGVLKYIKACCQKSLERMSQDEIREKIQFDKQLDDEIQRVVQSRFLAEKDSNGERNRLTNDKAQAYLFSKSAVNALENLIQKMQTLANVHIVLSSDWRKGYSVDEIKEIFSMHSFSQLIIDKTTEEDKAPYENWKNCCSIPHYDLSYYFLQMHKSFSLRWSYEIAPFERHIDWLNKRCRASEINQWLNQHPEYEGYVIFDDIDSHLSNNFGEKYISTEHINQLTTEHTDKAYAVFLNFINNQNKNKLQSGLQ